MSEEMKLLPCPFCGGDTFTLVLNERELVKCNSQKCHIAHLFFTPLAWNTRTQPRQMPSEEEAVEVMAKAAYEEYFRGGGKDCVWDNATSNERIIHCSEARAAYRALTALMEANPQPDNTQALCNELGSIKELQEKLALAVHDREHAERQLARIAAENMRLREQPDNTQLIADFKACVEALHRANSGLTAADAMLPHGGQLLAMAHASVDESKQSVTEALALAEKYKQLFEGIR